MFVSYLLVNQLSDTLIRLRRSNESETKVIKPQVKSDPIFNTHVASFQEDLEKNQVKWTRKAKWEDRSPGSRGSVLTDILTDTRLERGNCRWRKPLEDETAEEELAEEELAESGDCQFSHINYADCEFYKMRRSGFDTSNTQILNIISCVGTLLTHQLCIVNFISCVSQVLTHILCTVNFISCVGPLLTHQLYIVNFISCVSQVLTLILCTVNFISCVGQVLTHIVHCEFNQLRRSVTDT